MSNVLYQIDFSAVAAGKRVTSSKRKIRWRFGWANQQSIDDGMTGTDCRGEEHEVSIVWSITSGKRQIQMDGKEVHYSTNRAGTLDFSWQTKGNHVIKVLCHAAPPMSAEPDFRQYDLSVDGQPFFRMPKVFQIGIKGSVPHKILGAYRSNNHNPISPVSIESSLTPTTQEQEEENLRRAIEASIKDAKQHLGEIPKDRTSYVSTSNGRSNDGDLLGFGGPTGADAFDNTRSVASFFSAPTTYDHNHQSPPPPTTYPTPDTASAVGGALVPAVAPGYCQAPLPPATGQPPYASSLSLHQPLFSSPPLVPPAPAPTPDTRFAPQQPVYNAFGASVTTKGAPDVFGLHSSTVVTDDPFEPKPSPPPTHEDLASAVLASYQTIRDLPLTHTAPGGVSSTHSGEPLTEVLSISSVAVTTVDEKPKSEFEKALLNLVNIDHIDEPVESEIKLTMMKKQEKDKKVKKGRSIPKPHAGKGMVGSNAPLFQIKRDFVHEGNKTTEIIMNAPPPGAFAPCAANVGQLVVHGRGPPPLQQAQGFGVGAQLPNGGFQNQQSPLSGYMQQQQQT